MLPDSRGLPRCVVLDGLSLCDAPATHAIRCVSPDGTVHHHLFCERHRKLAFDQCRSAFGRDGTDPDSVKMEVVPVREVPSLFSHPDAPAPTVPGALLGFSRDGICRNCAFLGSSFADIGIEPEGVREQPCYDEFAPLDETGKPRSVDEVVARGEVLSGTRVIRGPAGHLECTAHAYPMRSSTGRTRMVAVMLRDVRGAPRENEEEAE